MDTGRLVNTMHDWSRCYRVAWGASRDYVAAVAEQAMGGSIESRFEFGVLALGSVCCLLAVYYTVRSLR